MDYDEDLLDEFKVLLKTFTDKCAMKDGSLYLTDAEIDEGLQRFPKPTQPWRNPGHVFLSTFPQFSDKVEHAQYISYVMFRRRFDASVATEVNAMDTATKTILGDAYMKSRTIYRTSCEQCREALIAWKKEHLVLNAALNKRSEDRFKQCMAERRAKRDATREAALDRNREERREKRLRKKG